MPGDEAGLRRWLANRPPSPAPYRDLLGLLDYLGIEQAHLLGLEDGANIALEFALECPERTDALVLVSPTVEVDLYKPTPWPTEAVTRGLEQAFSRAAQGLKMWKEASSEREAMALFVDWVLEDPAYATSTEATRRRLRKILVDNGLSPFSSYREHNTAKLDPPPGEKLHEIEAPTLLLAGERDSVKREMIETWMVPSIETSTEVTIPGASGMANMDRPEELNEAVLGFLKSL